MWVALLLTLRAGLPRECGLPASAQVGLQARHLGGIPAQQVEAAFQHIGGISDASNSI